MKWMLNWRKWKNPTSDTHKSTKIREWESWHPKSSCRTIVWVVSCDDQRVSIPKHHDDSSRQIDKWTHLEIRKKPQDDSLLCDLSSDVPNNHKPGFTHLNHVMTTARDERSICKSKDIPDVSVILFLLCLTVIIVLRMWCLHESCGDHL